MGALPSKILFLIAGNAGHGKDSFAGMLKEIMSQWTEVYSTAYAYGIKKIIHDNYGTPWEILEGTKDVKESTFVQVGRQQSDVIIRRALQKIGQFHRETFGPTCWAASALNRCKDSNARVCIITDARHPLEEVHWIGEEATDAGFLTIPVRVRRSGVTVNADHPSESLILAEPDASFSFLVENEGTLTDLYKMAEQVACAAVLLQKTGKTKLQKKNGCFVVREGASSLPYEPQLVKGDAESLVDGLRELSLKDGKARGPLAVDLMQFDLLKGAACAH